jgi:hypothetical protein
MPLEPPMINAKNAGFVAISLISSRHVGVESQGGKVHPPQVTVFFCNIMHGRADRRFFWSFFTSLEWLSLPMVFPSPFCEHVVVKMA